jgi:hypothetical protein
MREHEAGITALKSALVQQQKSFESNLAEQRKQIEALTSGHPEDEPADRDRTDRSANDRQPSIKAVTIDERREARER